jgi:hypothetical protein
MKVEELIGSLLTCKLVINEKTDKKVKSIAFVTNADDEETQGDPDSEESITEALVLVGKQFNKMIKRVDRRQKPNGRNIRFDISKQQIDQCIFNALLFVLCYGNFMTSPSILVLLS